MKKYILPMILICYITFSMISCAPSPENAHYAKEGNYLILGFWHGIIIPFSLIGKIIGLNIGLYHSKMDGFSYWIGYVFALIQYVRIIKIFWPERMAE